MNISRDTEIYIAIGSEVNCETPPVNVGPMKNAANPMMFTRASATDGATPGTRAAAFIKAGTIGPIPNPAAANPIQMIITAGILACAESGTAIAIARPQVIPAK